MGSDSYKAWNDWMDGVDNHVYSLFDIWEAGRNYQEKEFTTWREAVFDAEPNIDLLIEYKQRNNK